MQRKTIINRIKNKDLDLARFQMRIKPKQQKNKKIDLVLLKINFRQRQKKN